MALESQAGSFPDGLISEWRPTRGTALAWMILSVPILAMAWALYELVALRGQIPTEWSINSNDMILVLALVLGLACLHEAVHGVVVLAFGARPQFGILKIGGVLAGFYTTAPGHRFSRRRYLILCLAPLVLLAPLGVPACMLPFGAYLAPTFAVHLAGCIGDVGIAWHVLREPSDALCEDLRDGVRFWRAERPRR
jgi:hypothetical protein